MYFTGALGESLVISQELINREGASFLDSSPLFPDSSDNRFFINKINVDNLAVIVRNYLRVITNDNQLEIVFKTIKFPNSTIYGALHKDGKSEVTIYTNLELNDCWTRFVKCKELMQLYVDSNNTHSYREYSSSEIIKQIKEVIRSQGTLISADDVYEFDAGYESEAIAFLATIDLFFPKEDKLFVHILGEMIAEKKGYTNYDLALTYKTPEFIVKFYRKYIEKMSMALLNIV